MRKEKQNGKHLIQFSSEGNRKQKKSQGSRGYQCWVLPTLLRKLLGGSSLKLPFKVQIVGLKNLVSSALFYIQDWEFRFLLIIQRFQDCCSTGSVI